MASSPTRTARLFRSLDGEVGAARAKRLGGLAPGAPPGVPRERGVSPRPQRRRQVVGKARERRAPLRGPHVLVVRMPPIVGCIPRSTLARVASAVVRRLMALLDET